MELSGCSFFGPVSFDTMVRMPGLHLSSETTVGTGLALLGSLAPPGITLLSGTYTWIAIRCPDGTKGYMPIWK